MLTSCHLHMKSREVCIKARSPPASLAFMARAGLFESRLTLTQGLTLTEALCFLVLKCFSPLIFGVV